MKTTKECPKHGEQVHHTERDGRERCSACAAERVKKMQRERRVLLLDEAGGRCVRCGYDNPDVLQFHHRDPSTKEFKVTTGTRSLDAQRKEAAKCDLLCANCHIEAHVELSSR